MNIKTIRKKFLDYFRKKQHALIPSSSVVPHEDPTLLFINAGMNQFKDVFLGKSVLDYKRATSSQKCIRVGGKHNDLENVGHTKRHLTFFEMLGNFSFGDYFKEQAIRYSWEVSTEIFGFDPHLIFPTVFFEDEEAFEIWKQYVPEKQITRFGEKDNFWAMGETGPCGPSSELYYDKGPQYGSGKNPKEDTDGKRYLEYWNLVFMQFNRDEKGIFHPLPKPSIDTGAGIERVADLLLGVDSVFETDILRRLIGEVESISGITYIPNDEKSSAFRVIADHMRCLSFAIADGAQPSNIERGYVLRKVLRRAVRYAKQLKIEKPFLAKLLPSLIETMGEDYPELINGKERILEILTSEEEAFIRTLRRGGNLLNQIIQDALKKKNEISGDDAFKLKDTYGLPLEEILLIAKDSNLTIDKKRYEHLESEAKKLSKKMQKSTCQVAKESLFANLEPSNFLGDQTHRVEGKVLALVVDNKLTDTMQTSDSGIIVLDKTPFYAEMGGQIGDAGILESKNSLFEVSDTQSPFTGITAHVGSVKKGVICIGETLVATIDSKRREKIEKNHTATHLLHFALYKVLGPHVKQAGSVVEPGRLRFDFSHHKALSQEEIDQIEDLVNAKIRQNLPVTLYELPYEEVQNRPEIRQFFGEKYGTFVRVVDIDYSKELCGGMHTSSVGNIGYFRIVKESSIAAGVRRIEACTGKEAEQFVRESEKNLAHLATLLKTQPQKLNDRILKLLEDNKEMAQQLKNIKIKNLQNHVNSLSESLESINGIPLVVANLSLPPEDLRFVADTLVNQIDSVIIVVGSSINERAHLYVTITDDWIQKGLNAGKMIQNIAPIIQGGGGGRAKSAQAGGSAFQNVNNALDKARELLNSPKSKWEK